MIKSSAVHTEQQQSVLIHPGSSWAGSTETARVDLPIYEKLLDLDARWALSEGSRHFEENSAVFKALHNITQRLKALGVPYAVIGGMALFQHGYRRFTEDVDILVTREDLKKIHEKLEGLGYLPPVLNSKHLRDTQLGVRIEFLTMGEYPGDGKKKPVVFPDPRTASFEADGISYINLEKLVELKLASGMTNAGRLRDLSDVMELIKALDLPADFALRLDPFVRDKYRELWKDSRKRYITNWRNKWLTSEAKSIKEMVSMLQAAADELVQMHKDGVFLDGSSGLDDDNTLLVTMDPRVAEKYGLVDEAEYWDMNDEEAQPEDDRMDTPRPA